MNFDNPWVFVSAAFISLVGAALFIYGRNAQEPKCLGAGIAMCVFPLFVTSLVLMWLLAGACMFGAYALPRAN
jgi:hypothetical protein